MQCYKVYEAMFRVIKESENVDERQHCFLIQTTGGESRYFSMETRAELLRLESAWHRAVCSTISQLGVRYVNIEVWLFIKGSSVVGVSQHELVSFSRES